MKDKLLKAKFYAAMSFINAALYKSGVNTNIFTEEERKELELMDNASIKKRDRILEILEGKPLPDLDALYPEDELNLDALFDSEMK